MWILLGLSEREGQIGEGAICFSAQKQQLKTPLQQLEEEEKS